MKVGDRYEYAGNKGGYHQYFHITRINPILVTFDTRDHPDGPYSPEEFKAYLLTNYKPSETTKVTQILNEYH